MPTAPVNTKPEDGKAKEGPAEEETDFRKTLLETLEALKEGLPKGETKPLQGSVSASETYEYIAELVAYSTVGRIAEGIAQAVKDQTPGEAKILLLDQLDCAAYDVALSEVRAQIEAFEKALSGQIRAAGQILGIEAEELEAVPILPLIPAIAPLILPAISMLADVAGYFKTDYTLKGQAFEIAKEALVSATAGSIMKVDRKVFVTNFYQLGQSQVIEDFADRQQQAIELKMRTRQLSNYAQGEASPTAQVENAKQAVSAAEVLLEVFDTFAKALVTAADEKSPPKLVQAALRERIEQLEPTHLLYVNILSSGGEAITRQGIFNRSGKTSFLGGVTACYVLAKSDGEIVASGVPVKLGALDYELSGQGENKIQEIL